jgi:hypothetical protein
MYNLTNSQKDLLQRLVQKVRAGDIPEEFFIHRTQGKNYIGGNSLDVSSPNNIEITQLEQDEFEDNNLLKCTGQQCHLTGKAYEAVDTNFNAPDTSFS